VTDEGATGLEARLREQAEEVGFALFGIASADATEHMDFYRGWLGEGRHGEMAWLAREDSVRRRADLTTTLADVRSIVVVAHEYHQPDSPDVLADPATAVVAQYARGDDYHDVVKKKLLGLLAWLRAAAPEAVEGRAYVDTGPILERDLARRAGLGWFGKNTMLISPGKGSYFFLGLLLLDVPLTPTGAFEDDRCGTCSACLDACPTGALLGRDDSGAPVIDARRCISYLTIELRSPIPRELRAGIGNRVFGCDICQEVCPWNARFAEPASEDAYRPREGLELPGLTELADELLGMDDEGFRERFRKSPLRRTKREGLLRNVCVALGNLLAVSDGPGASSIVSLLERALRDPHPLVRGHAAWALGRVSTELPEAGTVRSLLSGHAMAESDPDVTDEIEAALAI
jgi:epoxyqueuosine reductase